MNHIDCRECLASDCYDFRCFHAGGRKPHDDMHSLRPCNSSNRVASFWHSRSRFSATHRSTRAASCSTLWSLSFSTFTKDELVSRRLPLNFLFDLLCYRQRSFQKWPRSPPASATRSANGCSILVQYGVFTCIVRAPSSSATQEQHHSHAMLTMFR